MLKKWLHCGDNISEFKEKKKKEIRNLANVHVTYMTQKTFPNLDDPKGRDKALKLCFVDSACGTGVLVCLFLVMDLFYQLLGNVLVYVIFGFVTFGVLFLKNWMRYKKHCVEIINGGGDHAN